MVETSSALQIAVAKFIVSRLRAPTKASASADESHTITLQGYGGFPRTPK